jgi:hypothetical protein
MNKKSFERVINRKVAKKKQLEGGIDLGAFVWL